MEEPGEKTLKVKYIIFLLMEPLNQSTIAYGAQNNNVKTAYQLVYIQNVGWQLKNLSLHKTMCSQRIGTIFFTLSQRSAASQNPEDEGEGHIEEGGAQAAKRPALAGFSFRPSPLHKATQGLILKQSTLTAPPSTGERNGELAPLFTFTFYC